MNLILNSIVKEYAGHQVLDEISFSIGDREIVGLIGENGSGKTTLLKIIAGLEKQDSGVVELIPSDTSIGYIPQATEIVSNQTVRDFLIKSLTLEQSEKYKVDIALSDIGLTKEINTKLNELSSGQRTKVYLARLLVNKPNILLLDEPTNHLDQKTLEWLEKYLQRYDDSVLVISHDRKFLDNLVNKIMELENGKIKIYGGNYSFYREQKQIQKEAEVKKYEEQQRVIKKTEKKIIEKRGRIQKLEKSDRPTRDNDKFAATFFANRASRKYGGVTQALKTRLEKTDRIEKPKADLSLSAIFKPKMESGKTVLYLKNVCKNLGGKQLFTNFNLLIERKERVALLGPNGSGKTTLINLIMNKIPPDDGNVEIGNNVEIGYLPQEYDEINSSETLLDYLVNNVTKDKTLAYKLASRFLYSDENLRTSVSDLSSGQKSRLVFARIMASGANFIILDEPTNHLDIPSREALEIAIASYSGTLLVITHDRYFLNMINPDKIVELK